MGKKKSAAQIRRMQKRAAERGTVYKVPVNEEKEEQKFSGESGKETKEINAEKVKLREAKKLIQKLNEAENNTELKSKDRRSLKRKAEAQAAEAVGCPATELREWYEAYKVKNNIGSGKDKDGKSKKQKSTQNDGFNNTVNPYIAFVGQLSYDTTKEGLFRHIQTHLKDEHKVTSETVRIRLLTDGKTKKSRGMAFVQTTDPELLYGLLKLHHTNLDNRRINIERSAGGKKNSEARQNKLTQFRKEQEEYMADVVAKMFATHIETGELREDELDAGVIELCKRHSASIVEAALTKYLESNGRDMDNPSSYFNYLITTIANEGLTEHRAGGGNGKGGGQYKRSTDGSKPIWKRPRTDVETSKGVMGSKLRDVKAT